MTVSPGRAFQRRTFLPIREGLEEKELEAEEVEEESIGAEVFMAEMIGAEVIFPIVWPPGINFPIRISVSRT